ncbi:hypothetical protein SNE40_009439 [Patella caerulea]|uniref:Uncharacterized protein n=1 Tax=Patella caerulea TaxID=87958 RepID=A0AAN8PQ90_PATCE
MGGANCPKQIHYIAFIIIASQITVQAAVFSLGIYVPSEGPRRMGFEADIAVNLTMARINSDPDFTAIRERNHSFNYLKVNSACEPGQGLYQFVEMTKRLDGINAVIGNNLLFIYLTLYCIKV